MSATSLMDTLSAGCAPSVLGSRGAPLFAGKPAEAASAEEPCSSL